MSCFGGRMKEYQFISIDQFEKENLSSHVYFLSHCHSDHMVGLRSPVFKDRVYGQTTCKIYCSFITKELVLFYSEFQYLRNVLSPLPLEEPFMIPEPGKDNAYVTVTLLPAEHCIGSTMFLFEGGEGNVLYTGDIRLSLETIKRCSALHVGLKIKDLTSVYIDTTFCTRESMIIPPRETCISAVICLIEKWLTQSPSHMVQFCSKIGVGHEVLHMKIKEHFKMPIHLNEERLRRYWNIPEVKSCYTCDESLTRIHACSIDCQAKFDHEKRTYCGVSSYEGAAVNVLNIIPSTMWFLYDFKPQDLCVRSATIRKTRVCFSFHSSGRELEEIVSYLRPTSIYPNVKPPGNYSLQHVHNLIEYVKDHLESIVKKAVNLNTSVISPDYVPLGEPFFGQHPTNNENRSVQVSANSSESPDPLEDLQPIKFKYRRIEGNTEARDNQKALITCTCTSTSTIIRSTCTCTSSGDSPIENNEKSMDLFSQASQSLVIDGSLSTFERLTSSNESKPSPSPNDNLIRNSPNLKVSSLSYVGDFDENMYAEEDCDISVNKNKQSNIDKKEFNSNGCSHRSVSTCSLNKEYMFTNQKMYGAASQINDRLVVDLTQDSDNDEEETNTHVGRPSNSENFKRFVDCEEALHKVTVKRDGKPVAFVCVRGKPHHPFCPMNEN